jgi:hypothetical protein
VHWPWSGSVAQDISPSLLFKSGDSDTEVRVLREVASYGKQIGKLTEVLLAIAKVVPKDTLGEDVAQTVAELQCISDNIERIKKDQKPLPDTLEGARDLLKALKKAFPDL